MLGAGLGCWLLELSYRVEFLAWPCPWGIRSTTVRSFWTQIRAIIPSLYGVDQESKRREKACRIRVSTCSVLSQGNAFTSLQPPRIIRSFLMGFNTPFKNKLDRHNFEPRLIPTNHRLGLLFVAPT